jgi:acylphosphatase
VANAEKCLRCRNHWTRWDREKRRRVVLMIARKCIVGGRVQGVFYRATAAHRARELGITGHAINLPDGRVEVLACGSPQALQTFIDWLWTGSSASKVTSVEVTEMTLADSQRPSGFRTG